MNPAFWSTFVLLMPCKPKLVMRVLGSMQQSQSLLQPYVQPPPQLTPQPYVQRTTQQSVQPTGRRIVPSTEPEMAVRGKILLEPEGNSYMNYYYWLSYLNHQVRRNFEVRGAKQLMNFFTYARKSGKVPDFVSPNNWAQLQKYWECPDFQTLSSQNKKNRSSDHDGVDPSLRTCGPTPITEWRRRMAVTLQREPTVNELYKDIHMYRTKDKQGNWVCKKSKLRLGGVYGFGAEGVMMKRQFPLLVSIRSSVKNYGARKMAIGSLRVKSYKAARQEESLEEDEQDVEVLQQLARWVFNSTARYDSFRR
ncbi:hypothetical protein Cgig2_026730 [Carnegiea gigantea]|uniref:Uncharacterized protein n=1 Tax=Carnegiea gigantea TaxID=171969 RepID=A0A9Q1Q7N1_9CARY|nr:hypothetical protein Cgig2_026730 [Carnegiea gigantea]